MPSDPTDLLPLHPRDHALLVALAEDSLHGYALMERIPEISDGRIGIGPATLYRTLDRMESDDLVVAGPSESAPGSGPPRTPYRITRFGREVLRAETDRLAAMVARVRSADAARGS